MRLHLQKKHVLIGISVCVVLFILLYGGMKLIGGRKEKSIPIPSELQGSSIIFTQPMYYEIGQPQEGPGTLSKIGRRITSSKSLGQYYPNRFTYEHIPEGMTFTVIGAESSWSEGLAAIDSGSTPMGSLILRDANGKESFISYLEFTTRIGEDGTLTDVHSASYYKDGHKIGDVVLPITLE